MADITISTGDSLKRKRSRGICIVAGCGKLGEKDRRRKKRNNYCTKHRHLIQSTRNPCRYAYRKLKSNAKRRDKVFTITYEYFEAWCKETNYLQRRGRKAGYFTIDRADDTKGYEPGNLKIMEHNQNVKKQYIDKWLDAKYGSGGGVASRSECYDECEKSDAADSINWDEIDLPF